MAQFGYECSDGVCRKVDTSGPVKLKVYDLGAEYVLLEWNNAGFEHFQVDMLPPGSEEWQTLSKSLRGPFVKKKSLKSGHKYSFRIKGFVSASGKWSDYSDTIQIETVSDEALKPFNVKVLKKEAMESQDGMIKNKITIDWTKPKGVVDVIAYSLEYRRMSETEKEWILASDKIKNTQVAKKNISPGSDWVFRVRARNESGWGPWSSPSDPTETVSLHESFINLVGNDSSSLIQGSQLAPVHAATLAGKIVAVYFSASWCPPCQQFTPMLIQFYNSLKSSGQPFEVIFVSSDRDENSFREYFKKMPWLAIKFSSPRRQQIQAGYQVQGIPHLKVFGPKGNLISQNAVQEPLNYTTFQRWQSLC